jgi:hypothetical protein
VVSLHDTSKIQAEEALAQLAGAGANVLGTFVTGAETELPTVVPDVTEV